MININKTKNGSREKSDMVMGAEEGDAYCWDNPKAEGEMTVFHLLELLLKPRICGMFTKDGTCLVSGLNCEFTNCKVAEHMFFGEQDKGIWTMVKKIAEKIQKIPIIFSDDVPEEKKREIVDSANKRL